MQTDMGEASENDFITLIVQSPEVIIVIDYVFLEKDGFLTPGSDGHRECDLKIN